MKSMSVRKQLKSTILKKVLGHLMQYGFDKKIHCQSFWKYIDNGRAMVHLSFIDHENDFDVTASVSIRFNVLEEMINEGNILLKPKEKLETSTIGIELGNLAQGKQKRWTVSKESDIDDAIEGICGIIDRVAIPYIEKYKFMENTFEIMLRDDEEIWIFAPFHHRRAMNAVGLAKLLNKDNINEIADAKRSFLSERNDHGLSMFVKFSEKLIGK